MNTKTKKRLIGIYTKQLSKYRHIAKIELPYNSLHYSYCAVAFIQFILEELMEATGETKYLIQEYEKISQALELQLKQKAKQLYPLQKLNIIKNKIK